MIELESVKRMQSLKSAVEAKTGATYNDLTEAVQDLVNPNAGKEIAKLIAADGTECIYGSVSDALAMAHTKPVNYVLYGKSTQDGEPTPENPVEIVNGYQNAANPTASVPVPLCGIPVTSGGNYTDADGQMWVCDEVDFVRGVRVQRTKKHTYTGASGEEWRQQSATVPVYKEQGVAKDNLLLSNNNLTGVVISDCYKTIKHNEIYSDYTVNAMSISSGTKGVFVRASNFTGATAQEFMAWLAEHPITVLYALEEPIETPLTADELAAYRALLGETVQMIADSTEKDIIVPGGVTLDLNGYVLTADKFISFGNVVDDSTDNTALLKVPQDKVKLSADNTQLPVRNAEGYIFAEILKMNQAVQGNKYMFQPMIEVTAHEALYTGREKSGVSISAVNVHTTTEKWQLHKMTFLDDNVQAFIDSYKPSTGKYGSMFSATYSEEDITKYDPEVWCEVASETGVVIASQPLKFS